MLSGIIVENDSVGHTAENPGKLYATTENTRGQTRDSLKLMKQVWSSCLCVRWDAGLLPPQLAITVPRGLCLLASRIAQPRIEITAPEIVIHSFSFNWFIKLYIFKRLLIRQFNSMWE